ncbi:MAG: hypothetical protein KDM63_14145, partial [Verrucomicrobiae bacterium]|nr:hypothetical protein [Verrucomicrobiae bacterium]
IRAALTSLLPARSRAVKAKFTQLESLIDQFGITPEGRAFIAVYRRSRQVVDRGKSGKRRKKGETETETEAGAEAGETEAPAAESGAGTDGGANGGGGTAS